MTYASPSRSGALLRWLPLLCGATLFCLLLAAEAMAGVHANGGMFVYPLDDTYIHMTLARNLALHGNWGINPGQFASASSSPGWTLLLAGAVKLFGDRTLLPLWLNAVFAIFILAFADRTLRRWDPTASTGYRLLLQVGLVLLTPLPSLALVGMEHCAQTFAVLVMCCLGVEAAESAASSGGLIALAAASYAAAALRYETVFAVIAVGGLLLWRRQYLPALLVAFAAAVPPAAFGIYAHRHGPFWLPFSVVAKSRMIPVDRSSVVQAWIHFHPFDAKIALSTLAVGAAALAVARGHRRAQMLTGVFLVIYVLHITLAPVGWLNRYEAYLAALGWLCISLGLVTGWPQWRRALADTELRPTALAVGVMTLALVYPAWVVRVGVGLRNASQSMNDRYNEHIQPALFLAKNYDHTAVVACDIGAISYLTHDRVLDVIGLGSVEPLVDDKLPGGFNAVRMQAWATREGAQLAVIQSAWPHATDVMPAGWVQVQTWRFPRNVVFENYQVTFYAVHPEDAARLKQQLNAWALPAGMTRADHANIEPAAD